jgi:putative ABC transport system permease protein
VTKVLQASAGVGTWVGLSESQVAVTGLPGSTQVLSYTGPASASAQYFRMISGRWFAAPGEIVVAKPFLTATRKRVGDQVELSDRGRRITVRIVGEVFNVEEHGTQVVAAAGTLQAAEPDLQPDRYNVTMKAGGTAEALSAALNPGLKAVGAEAVLSEAPSSDQVTVMNALAGLLSVLLLAAAGLGVLNTVLLETRDRVHELGVFKALGMTPRQTVAMVIGSVVVTGLLGGLAGTAVGQQLQRAVLWGMADSVGFNLPPAVLDVYGLGSLALFCTAGLVIAVLGALLPAGWAAGSRTASALRTE